MGITTRLRHAWNAFSNEEDKTGPPPNIGRSTGFQSTRTGYSSTNEKTIMSAILTRIAADAAAVDIRHVRVDEDNRYLEDVSSWMQQCLQVSANIDQSARQFRMDVFSNLLEDGYIAVVPTETNVDLTQTLGFDIMSYRVGSIIQWYPRHVKVQVYDDRPVDGGVRRELILPKDRVAIVTNPFYEVMNQPNSTVKRLIRKLQLLDAVDEQSGSGKLDLIIQLPYVIKSEARQQQADMRRAAIEDQLAGSKYGIAYTDSTEKITQLNRPSENNLMAQVEYLTKMLYSQMGLTDEVLNGTADEKTMLNYNNRTVEPLVAALTDAMNRTFLTKTARTQGQRIMYFREPFRLLPMSELADVADKLARNEILTSNELRQMIGFKPAGDPKADQLINSNMPQPTDPSMVDQQVPTDAAGQPPGPLA